MTTVLSQEQVKGDDDDVGIPQIVYGKIAHTLINNEILLNNNNNENSVEKINIVSSTWKTDDAMEFENASGTVYITSDKLFFLCSSEQDHSVVIDAKCIQLHAQQQKQDNNNNNNSLYLQLKDFSSSSQEEILEFTLWLSSTNDDCQRLFEALSLLVSMNPDDEDDDEEEMFPNMGGDNFFSNNSNDDMVVFNPSSEEVEEYNRRTSSWSLEAKEQEHSEEEVDQVMLDHLDSMLIVPPHLEINDNDDHDDNNNDGQFDDADNDDMNLL